MNQKLSEWANIADIFSGIAVVITLVFLIVSVQANTAALRATAYESNLDDINAFQYEILSNPDSLRVFEAWANDRGENLDSSDQFRLNLILGVQAREFESSYFAYRYGLIGEQEWGRLSGSLCRSFQQFDEYGQRIPRLTEEFIGYINERCSDSPFAAE